MWQITNHLATAQNDQLRAQVDLRYPQLGIHNLVVGGCEFTAARLLGFALDDATSPTSAQVTDSYIRGNDLVVTYAQTKERSNQTQLYWRFTNSAPDVFGFELIYSFQTSLWETLPIAMLRTIASTQSARYLKDEDGLKFHNLDFDKERNEVLTTSGTFAVIVRPTRLDVSYVELLDPAEQIATKLRLAATDDDGIALQYEIDSDRLEKGVIRRGRIRGLFIPRENDEQTALSCLKQFANAPPPLTT